MQAFVHFTVGVILALVILMVIDRPVSQEFLVMFASGVWGLIPDGHWMLREAGYVGVADRWRAVHETRFADLFWFHHYLDSIETGRNNLEAGIALAALCVVVVGYYWYNNWEST